MTVDAAQYLAVHATGKMIRRHEQRTLLSIGARRRKSRHAVTAEAGRVGEILGTLGDCGLYPNEDGRKHDRPQRSFARVHGSSPSASERRTRGKMCRALSCSIRYLKRGFT